MTRTLCIAGTILAILTSIGCTTAQQGISNVTFRGFDRCSRVTNGNAEIVAVPQSGGRLLNYALNGRNILFRDPAVDGDKLVPGKRAHLDAGRLDIGPETHPTHKIPPRPVLWSGQWAAQVCGPLSLRLTSQECPSTGVQITRLFELSPDSSHLLVRQTMTNVSDKTTYWCFWSRTLAKGGGICMAPINPKSKFPKGYARYIWGRDRRIETVNPEGPRIKVVGDLVTLEAIGEESLKIGMDSSAQWMAYACDGLLFVKRFRYFPDGEYTDALGFSVAIYLNDRMCELEPISPQAILKPGESYTFDEEWWLFDYPAGDQRPLDFAKIKQFVAANTKLSE